MARASREEIFAALFALTQGVQWNIGTQMDPVMVGFEERSRVVKLFSDVPAKDQPWIGQAEHGEKIAQKTNLPYRRVYSAKWIIYHRAPDQPNQIGVTWNNLIVDALEACMAPKPGDPGFLDRRNSLSGRVYHCFIDGEVFKDPGDIDKQALIVVPISILVP